MADIGASDALTGERQVLAQQSGMFDYVTNGVFSDANIDAAKQFNNTYQVGTRTIGAVQTVAGGLGVAGSVATAPVSCATGVGCIASAAVASNPPPCPADYRSITLSKSSIAVATFLISAGDATLSFRAPSNISIRVCFGISPKPIVDSKMAVLSETYEIKTYLLETGVKFTQLTERKIVINYGLNKLPADLSQVASSSIKGVTDSQGSTLSDTEQAFETDVELDVAHVGAQKLSKTIYPNGDGRYAVAYKF